MALPEGKTCYLLNGSPGDCAAGLLCARIPDPDNPTHRGVDGVCKKGNIYAQGTTAKFARAFLFFKTHIRRLLEHPGR